MDIDRSHPAFQLSPAQRARLGLDKAPTAQVLPTGHVKQADGAITLEPAVHAQVCAMQEPEQTTADRVHAFLRSCGVTMESTYLGERKYEATNWLHDAYTVTLRRGGTMVVTSPYSHGLGFRREGKPVDPLAVDVLACMVADAIRVAESAEFDDWADERDLPMSTKQERKRAREMYDSACRCRNGLMAMFSDPEMATLEAMLSEY